MSLSLVEAPSGRPDVELIALEDALQRLAALDERKSKVVELKFFGGLTIEEIAEVLQISGATVELLRVEWEVLEVRPSTSKADRGMTPSEAPVAVTSRPPALAAPVGRAGSRR